MERHRFLGFLAFYSHQHFDIILFNVLHFQEFKAADSAGLKCNVSSDEEYQHNAIGHKGRNCSQQVDGQKRDAASVGNYIGREIQREAKSKQSAS